MIRVVVTMKIPSKVKIGGITYSVVITENRNVENGDILMGEVTYTDAQIYLNEKCAQEPKEQTLLHEIFHVILRQMGRKDLNEDEYFVDGLSMNLYQVMKDNGWAFGGEDPETS